MSNSSGGSEHTLRLHRKWLRKLILGAVIGLGYETPAGAQSTWTGGGGSPYSWTVAANWGGTAPVSSATTALIFDGTTGLTNTNNFTSPFQLSTLTFNAGGGAFDILGSTTMQFASGGSITQNSTNNQIIANPIQTTGTFTVFGGGTGSLTLSGAISGTGGLTVNTTGSVIVSAAATYTGSTTVQSGTLTLGASNVLPAAAPLVFGSSIGSSGMQLNLNNFSQTVAGITIYAPILASTIVSTGTGTLTVNGNITLLDNSTSTGNGFPVTFTSATGGTLNLGGAVRNITVAGQDNATPPGDLIINVVIANGGINYTGNPSSTTLLATGMELGASAANTYALGTTVNAGTLTVLATTTLGTGGLTITQSGNVVSAVGLNGSMTITSLATGTLATAADALLSIAGTSSVLTVNQSSSTTFAGIISGVGGITKTGAGSLKLTNANTYTGATTVSAGTLTIGTGGSLVSAVTVNSTATLSGTGSVSGNVTVASGGTLSGGLSGTVGTLTLSGSVAVASGATIAVNIANGSTPSSSGGGSTIGTIPNPTSNNFLYVTGAGSSLNSGALITITDVGTSFTLNSAYSYEIAQFTQLNLSTLDITTQSQFSTVSFSAHLFSLTGNAAGDVFLNFTPTTPEPATILLFGAIGAGLFGGGRRVVNRGQGTVKTE